MLAKLLEPKVDLASLILRLGLAAIFTVHGYFKIVQDFPMIAQLSWLGQNLLGWAELILGLLLLVGLFSRLAGLGLIVLQTIAIVAVTWKRALAGPSIEAAGADYTRVGPEYNLVLIAMCLGVIVLGSGVLSLDHCLMTFFRGKKAGVAPAAAAGVGSPAPGQAVLGLEHPAGIRAQESGMQNRVS